MYTVRTAEGIMIAKLSEYSVGKILQSGDGRRVAKNFSGGISTMCFVLNGDGVYESNNIVLYLWEGSYIELYDL